MQFVIQEEGELAFSFESNLKSQGIISYPPESSELDSVVNTLVNIMLDEMLQLYDNLGLVFISKDVLECLSREATETSYLLDSYDSFTEYYNKTRDKCITCLGLSDYLISE